MYDARERLERLITRELDGECTPAEARALQRALDSDPAARDLFDELSLVDREVGAAMRAALAPETVVVSRTAWWRRAAQLTGLAAAACLLGLMLLGQPRVGESGAVQAGHGGEFVQWRNPVVDGPAQVDPAMLDLLHTGQRHTARNLIVIPGGRPGEYLVLEVQHVRTAAVPLHADY